MPKSTLDDILVRLHLLETELEAEIDRILHEKRQLFRYTLARGRIHFERGMKALHREHRTALWTYLRTARIGHILTAPLIYSLFIPFVLLDVLVTLYQHVCFRVYRIPLVRRREYLVIDHQHLVYLNIVEKFNCMYCGYSNGLIEYVREVTSRTEQFWCPIKHARRTPDPHCRTNLFVDYGDALAYKMRLEELRRELSALKQETAEQSKRLFG